MIHSVQDLHLLTWPNEILLKPTHDFDFSNPPVDPKELIARMKVIMNKHSGVGLAAPQIGFPYSVFIMGGPYSAEAVFNPEIITVSEETGNEIEGCLSFPALYANIKCPKRIEVTYQDVNGESHNYDAVDYDARVFMHEYMHLKGHVFVEKMSAVKLDRAISKATLFGAEYKKSDFAAIRRS